MAVALMPDALWELIEPVPPIAGALRETCRYSRGIPLPWVCSDLLALSACRLEQGLAASLTRIAHPQYHLGVRMAYAGQHHFALPRAA